MLRVAAVAILLTTRWPNDWPVSIRNRIYRSGVNDWPLESDYWTPPGDPNPFIRLHAYYASQGIFWR